MMFPDSYHVYRLDRNCRNSVKSRGGGVLIAVSSRFRSTLIPTADNVEQVWVRIHIHKTAMTLGAIYLPPDINNNPSILTSLTDTFDKVIDSSDDLLAVFGDFNYSSLVWNTDLANETPTIDASSIFCKGANELFDSTNYHGLTQVNRVPNILGKLLDLVFVSDDILKTDYRLSDSNFPIVKIDTYHPALELTIPGLLASPSATNAVVVTDPRLNYKRTNVDKLCTLLNQADWSFLDGKPDVNAAVARLNQTVLNLLPLCCPPALPHSGPPWSTAHLRDLKKYKLSSYRHYQRKPSIYTKMAFNIAHNKYRQHNHFLYRRYITRVRGSLTRNPRTFWQFINSKRRSKRIPHGMSFNGIIASTTTESCDLFAKI
ncbi:uncharacterized protein LOC118467962 [Anopheles albimanus]|uniref:uncharacterized protein LOC118467962 n=1 Tax=Anopheles albimanus TaxID=7167 RepID=UPI001642116A|nr:uncharacterized protein LOC118467962 [Anopheles albimanus]